MTLANEKGNRKPLSVLSITRSNKIRRGLWAFCEILVFRLSPIPCFRFRVFLLRLFGSKIHSSAKVYPTCKIWAPWNLEMQAGSCLARNVTCYNVARISLGAKATVSQGAHLCSASHDFRSRGHELLAAPIVIGENSWVAADVFVGPGVSIGDDAVLFARSVVTKDVPQNVVVAPAGSVQIGSRWRDT